jgi:hypothetical protein
MKRPDIFTVHCSNTFPSTATRLEKTLKLYRTETHPPPATAWLASSITFLNTTLTVFLLKLFLVKLTSSASTIPTAPPHAEHAVAVAAALGHVAVLF